MKYFIKPQFYIVVDTKDAKVDQAVCAEWAREFFDEEVLPYLQKWSKTKVFSAKNLQDVPRFGEHVTFAGLSDLLDENAKKKK